MVLHTLNGSPSSAAFSDCLNLLAASDALLLLGDGTYCAIADSAAAALLLERPVELYVLREDAAARGIAQQLLAGITLLDHDGFVELTERYPRQLAWY